MSMQLPAETIVCSEYQRLLEACVSAREIWKKHRAEIYRYRLVGKKKATNFFDCKQITLGRTTYCSATRSNASGAGPFYELREG
jgi:hypothetical protein